MLKIKEGCDKKRGGSDFPDVAMRLLGLSYTMAKKFVKIGKEAKKLWSHGTLLPSESISTIWTIACMEPDVIADKIERGLLRGTDAG